MPFTPSILPRRALALLILAAAAAPSLAAEETPGKQVEQSFKVSDTLAVPYLLYLPKDYRADSEKKWPVILFLHGRGESDGPLSIVAKWGPPRMAARGDDLPYIVISPQCPRESRWTAPEQQDAVLAVLGQTLENYRCDATRIYLTGLSMGGFGSWSLAAKHPDRFAAVAPVCGGGSTDDAETLADMPIWAFHGDQDEAVPIERSTEMVDAIKAAGGQKIRFTTLEHIGHNSWSAAYATPELYHWFDQHAKQSQ